MTKRDFLSANDCQCGLEEFYKNVATKLGIKVTEKTQYDCRKICITKPVLDYIWKYYSKRHYSENQLVALMIQYGPKANLKRNTLEFEAENGFILETE